MQLFRGDALARAGFAPLVQQRARWLCSGGVESEGYAQIFVYIVVKKEERAYSARYSVANTLSPFGESPPFSSSFLFPYFAC